jgi:hypothetical protein
VPPGKTAGQGGVRRLNRRHAMPSYDICYLNADGSLFAKLAAMCVDDKHAKILSHAMKLDGAKRIEVWDGATLVYERPQHIG